MGESDGDSTRVLITKGIFRRVVRRGDHLFHLSAERAAARFERGRPIRLWQPRRDDVRNEALDTTVYAMAALHGPISIGLRLNKETEALGVSPRKGAVPDSAAASNPPEVIRSGWMR